VDVDGDNPRSGRIEHASHLALYDGGTQLVAGKLTKTTESMRGGITDVTLNGQSHMHYLADRLTAPTPSKRLDQQNVDGWWKLKGPAEKIICDLVRLNVGQDAISGRQRDGFQVAASQGRGKQSSIETRFKPLLEEAQTLAKGAGLGFRTRMEPSGTIVFEVFQGRDLSRAVRLSQTNGALNEYTLEQAAPTVTSVLVAGQGEGSARTLRLLSGNTNDWSVGVEQFQDRRDTDDADELAKAGTETLEDGQETASITCTVTDLPILRFGRDYTLGDTITIQLANGVTITDTLQTAEIDWGPEGRTVTLQVGPVADEKEQPAWVKQVRSLRTKLRNLETR
ncbi:MAG: siphovirus ReqiPepy6 Gp37-like family protein, partial [Galactobacter sp.]